MKKLVSWNVNGLRACYKKGFLEWLESSPHQVVGLQEIKATQDQLPEELQAPKKYHAWFAPAQRKGYSGVALFSKKTLEKPDVQIGLGIEEFDSEGRAIIAEYKNFTLFNCYFPNGQRDHSRVPYKLAFSDAVAEKALELKRELKKPVIIGGDFNTAHQEIDLKNPKSNNNTTGFLPHEREWIDKFIQMGFTDVFRQLHPKTSDAYTWWTYRNNCRERNIGWRIDYFFVTDELMPHVTSAKILHQVMGSDHCPVALNLRL